MVAARHYTPSDYNMLAEWWTARNWPVMPEQFLSKTGLVTSFDSKPMAAGFLYKTDSAFAWLEWVVTDPNSDKFQRSQCLDLLIQTLIDEASALGFQAVHTSVSHPALIERCQKHGFVLSDSGMTNLTWVCPRP